MKVSVILKPGARQGKIEEVAGGYRVWVREPAIEGRANDALLRMLAEHLGIAKSRITIVSGARSRRKVLEIRPS